MRLRYSQRCQSQLISPQTTSTFRVARGGSSLFSPPVMRETQVPMAGMSDAKTTPLVFYDLVICKLCHAQRTWRVMLEGGKAGQMKKAAITTRIVSGEANF